jgi:signal transduction histidine kinase
MVENSGAGILEEEFDKIWIPFYKIDKSHSRRQGGTGLGLSIVKAIQDLHGNLYGAANTDTGVKFWFSLDRI